MKMLVKWNADKIHIPRCWFPPNFSTILGSVIEVEQINFTDFAYQYNYSPKNSAGCFLHKDWLESPWKRVKAEYMDSVMDCLQKQMLEVSRQNSVYYRLFGGHNLGHCILEDWVDGEHFWDGKWTKKCRKPGHIVAKYENGTFKASPSPVVHLEETKAVSEANRLAKENKGQGFAVLKEIYMAKEEKPKLPPLLTNLAVGNQLEVIGGDLLHIGTVVTISHVFGDGSVRIYGPDKNGSYSLLTVFPLQSQYKLRQKPIVKACGPESDIPF